MGGSTDDFSYLSNDVGNVFIAGAVVQLFADAHFFRMLGLPLSFSVTLYYT